jgi:hypothetical protein
VFPSEDLGEEMEMPTPCQHCGKIFDLNDGWGSDKWYPKTIICEACHELEEKEVELDEEIIELRNAIGDAEFTITESKVRLVEIQEQHPDYEFPDEDQD